LIENPLIENSTLPDGTAITYADVTAVIRNDGNVTTSYNVDVTATGFESTAGGDPVSQLILWKQYVYGTARDCKYVPEARNQVLATINNPDNELSKASIDEPFAGEGSIILAPGEQGFITYRFFGTVDELATAKVNGLTASSQAANCDEFDDNFGPPQGQEDDFYTCQDQISADRELIFLEIDTTPPVVTVPSSPVFETVQGPSGSIVNFDGLVSVTDLADPAPTLTCVPESGSMFAPGETTVTCTGEDASGNTASADFIVAVGYIGDGIYPTKLSVKAGSSNPLAWAWRDATGSIVDTSGEIQMLEITDCGVPATMFLTAAGDPGASGFRVKSDLSWEFNWQSDDQFRNPLEGGTYCARVSTQLTNQLLTSPPINVR
jgi:hypothetical protein